MLLDRTPIRIKEPIKMHLKNQATRYSITI